MHSSLHFSQVRLFKFADYNIMSAHMYIVTLLQLCIMYTGSIQFGLSLVCKHSLLDKEDIPIARVHNSRETTKVRCQYGLVNT